MTPQEGLCGGSVLLLQALSQSGSNVPGVSGPLKSGLGGPTEQLWLWEWGLPPVKVKLCFRKPAHPTMGLYALYPGRLLHQDLLKGSVIRTPGPFLTSRKSFRSIGKGETGVI